MHQPSEPLPQYPTSAQMPQPGKPLIPPQIRNAVTAMYVGAAVTAVGVVIEILSIGATKNAIARRSPHLTASQVNVSGRTLVVGFVISGLIAVALWIVHARACRDGRSWARMTGTALFVLSTLDALAGTRAPVALAVRIWWPVIWLAGLAAVIFLWQRASTEYFKETRP